MDVGGVVGNWHVTMKIRLEGPNLSVGARSVDNHSADLDHPYLTGNTTCSLDVLTLHYIVRTNLTVKEYNCNISWGVSGLHFGGLSSPASVLRSRTSPTSGVICSAGSNSAT